MRSLALRSASISMVSLAFAVAGCDGCGDSGTTDGTGGGGAGNAVGTGSSQGGASGNGGSAGTFVGAVGAGGSTGSSCSAAVTCADVGAECGPIGDGCGNIIECGDCADGESCGGEPQVCGVEGCVPRTCADIGANCGPIGDGCGGLIEDCGSCSQPETCGGGDVPNVCAIPSTCTNLCLQQVTCDPGVTTTVSGIVYAPGRAGQPAPPAPGSADPLFDALVYIPNSAVLPFEPGVACSQCGEEASGDPLVSARTDAQGRFVLENVPVGLNIPMVIQLGRWRRQVTIDNVGQCVDTPLDQELTRLPRNKSEGDIPQIAIATGSVDALECVLRKIGVEDSEFTNPDGDGRIHLYRGAGSGGVRINNSTPSETVLLDDPARLDDYDMVLFPCQGSSYTGRATATRKSNLVDYASLGGRIFATHFSYDWMHNNGPFATVADWNVGNGGIPDQNGIINQGFPKGAIFAEWLVNVGASTVLGEMPVRVVRHDVDAVVPELATEWMSTNDMEWPLHLTFNTPVGAEPEDQCGRALFSDFHVADASTGSATFPNGCTGSQALNVAMTPQEKLVEFMLFDLGSCLTPDIPVCTPFTCADMGLECGPASDGCNGIIQCGDCVAPETCGGGGIPGVCGDGQCIPKTCLQLGKNCGQVSNGCGEVMNCGTCTGSQTCGGGGVANVCGGGVPG